MKLLLKLMVFSVSLVLFSAMRCSEPEHSEWGKFSGSVVGKWDDNGRDMILTEPFSYTDPDGKTWSAPAKSVVNGASIPKPFWSVIGGPFEGSYRNASVIHDVYCDNMNEPWEDVHRMFYQACRCGGVDENKAKSMYWAVYHFGPRWNPSLMIVGNESGDSSEGGGMASVSAAAALPVQELPDSALLKAMKFFEHNNPSLEEIESLEF